MAYVSQELKAKLAPTIKAVLKKYKVKGSISVRNHMSLVVTIKEGAVNFGKDHIQVNPYHIDAHYAGKARSRPKRTQSGNGRPRVLLRRRYPVRLLLP